jgi:hypothetical protein
MADLSKLLQSVKLPVMSVMPGVAVGKGMDERQAWLTGMLQA